MYSAHDNTIMALLSHLGFRDWDIPQFAAYLVFELHATGEAAASPYVRLAYNPNPEAVPFYEQRYLVLPEGDREIVDIRDAVVQNTSSRSRHGLQRFTNILMKQRHSFRDEAEWRQAGLAQDDITASLVTLTAEEIAAEGKAKKGTTADLQAEQE